MRVLCIDDEAILLKSMEIAVKNTGLADEVQCFTDEWEGLESAEKNVPDAAFLDIRLHELDGLDLAERLRKINPGMFIVFCTGFAEYAVDAINRGLANGYLLKPVRADSVRDMMEKALEKSGGGKTGKLLTVRCRGGFDAYDKNGSVLIFHRKRAKELLALLVHKNGMSITSKEICAMMFEDDGELDIKNMDHLRKLFRELRQVLEAAGAGDVLVRSGNVAGLDMEKIAVDDSGNEGGEYLPDYIWAISE